MLVGLYIASVMYFSEVTGNLGTCLGAQARHGLSAHLLGWVVFAARALTWAQALGGLGACLVQLILGRA